MFIFDNGSANSICNKVYGIKKPDFSDLNFVLSAQLSSFFFPTLGPHGRRSFKPLTDSSQLLVSDSRYKFAGLKYVPQMPQESRTFSVESWEALEGRAVQMQLGGTTEAEINWRVNVHSGRVSLLT